MFDRTDKDMSSPTNNYSNQVRNNPISVTHDEERTRDHSGTNSLKIAIRDEIKSESAETSGTNSNSPPRVTSPPGARTTKNNRARRRFKQNYETNTMNSYKKSPRESAQ